MTQHSNPTPGPWQRLRARFSPAVSKPTQDWDILLPDDIPTPDVEAAWMELRAEIDRHAAAGSFDEAHPDLVDRLISGQVNRWRHDATRHNADRVKVLRRLANSGKGTLTEVGARIAAQRREQQRGAEEAARAWKALCGYEPTEVPAAVSPELRTLPSMPTVTAQVPSDARLRTPEADDKQSAPEGNGPNRTEPADGGPPDHGDKPIQTDIPQWQRRRNTGSTP